MAAIVVITVVGESVSWWQLWLSHSDELKKFTWVWVLSVGVLLTAIAFISSQCCMTLTQSLLAAACLHSWPLSPKPPSRHPLEAPSTAAAAAIALLSPEFCGTTQSQALERGLRAERMMLGEAVWLRRFPSRAQGSLLPCHLQHTPRHVAPPLSRPYDQPWSSSTRVHTRAGPRHK